MNIVTHLHSIILLQYNFSKFSTETKQELRNMNSNTQNGKKDTPYWNLGEQEEEEASSFAMSLISNVTFEVLKAVSDLGVLEIIKKGGPLAHLSAADIAAKLPTKKPESAAASLGRLLDYLVSHSVLTVSPTLLDDKRVERRYGLAPVCKFFTSNEDGVSLAPFFNATMYMPLRMSCLKLHGEVLEGKQPFTEVHGMEFYNYMQQNSEYREGFHVMMSNHSILAMRKILRTYKGFKNLSTLVDVGGGSGVTTNMIVSEYPTIKGINFDRPHVVADAPSYAGVEHVGGDMFDSIPKGDAIFLKWVLHGCDDEECIKVLKNCYAALPEDGEGKVIVCEYILPSPHEAFGSGNKGATSAIGFDMMMMVLSGGKERTKEEYKALAIAAGFYGFQVVCSAYDVYIIELLKK